MTTVVCDGKYLIADRRTSITPHVRGFNYDVKIDDTFKIIQFDGLRHGGERIVAWAGTGDGNVLDAVQHYLTAFLDMMKTEGGFELEDLMHCINQFQLRPKSFARAVMLTDTGGVWTMELTPSPAKNANIQMVVKQHKKGVVHVFGSGAQFWDTAKRFATERLEAIDVFSLCAHADVHSSDKYSVLALGESKVIHVNPSAEEVRTRVHRAQSNLDFYRPSVKPKASRMETE